MLDQLLSIRREPNPSVSTSIVKCRLPTASILLPHWGRPWTSLSSLRQRRRIPRNNWLPYATFACNRWGGEMFRLASESSNVECEREVTLIQDLEPNDGGSPRSRCFICLNQPKQYSR